MYQVIVFSVGEIKGHRDHHSVVVICDARDDGLDWRVGLRIWHTSPRIDDLPFIITNAFDLIAPRSVLTIFTNDVAHRSLGNVKVIAGLMLACDCFYSCDTDDGRIVGSIGTSWLI